MKYVVLLSNGICDHDYKVYRTKEEALKFADRVKHKWNTCVIIESVESFEW